ncbi:alkylation response protein AidB-like acyl-CoA dehydrogenase [Kitasatospora sp. MAP12-15]|uniref:acyl-CoA dehydrogenase family protein n=1 Tax=unclassified Kitasatospora TaxID=2633591 RepID=UPI002475D1DD|nr:acyl-CoA dehydrogenase family protein [Kitasatospora sp. MAP12-44]MDH6111057.1 alkylation response protein AidB-like acyl-CoA dehydrogenase [Kitasatospora sp. MAP12-44]
MTDLLALMRDLEQYLGDPHDPASPMPYRRILELDEREEYPHEFVDLLQRWGLYDWIVPAANGGRAVNVEDGFNLFRLVARRDPTTATAMVLTSLSYMPVWVAGDPEQRQHYADLVMGGGKMAWGLSERRHGSDILANEMSARRVDGGWVLNGEKWTIGNATVADVVMLHARTGEKAGPAAYSVFALEKRLVAQGQFEELPDMALHGLRGLDMSGISLHDCFLPDAALLGRVGQGLEIALKSSQLARVAISSIAMSCADTALRSTLDFAAQREIFGSLVVDIPYSRRQLAECFAELLIADAVSWGAVRSLQLSPDQTSMWSSLVKYFVPALLEGTVNRLSVVLGARFYLREDPRHGIFQKTLRDFPISNFADGNSVVNLKNIALQLEPMLENALHGDPALAERAAERIVPLFDASRPMEPYQPVRQQLFSRGTDDLVLSLPAAVEGLRQAAQQADGPQAGWLARAADAGALLVQELHRLGAEREKLVADLGRAAAQSAELFDLAKQYAVLGAATACIRIHLDGGDAIDERLRSGAVLLLCLDQLQQRLHPTRRITGPAETDAVAETLLAFHRESRLFSLRAFELAPAAD